MKQRTIAACATAFILTGLIALAGCAPSGNTESAQDKTGSETVDQTQTLAAWSPDSDCATCHAKEASSAKEAGCLAQAHTELGYPCADCHDDEQGLTKAHGESASGAPASKLKATEVDDEACLACHESRAAIAEKTTDVALSDDRGTTVNPHELAPSPDHEAIACVDCHASHQALPALEEAQGTCASCHHAGVFECGTCHS